MRAPAKKDGRGRPTEHVLRPLVAIGAKLSITYCDLNLSLACAGVNEVCDDPRSGAGLAGVEGPLCASTLRKRVAACMGGPKWRDLRREAHICHYMSVLHSQCPHLVDLILSLVDQVVATVKGFPPAPPPLPQVAELPVEGSWDLNDSIGLDEIPLFAGLEDFEFSRNGGEFDDLLLSHEEIFKEINIFDFK